VLAVSARCCGVRTKRQRPALREQAENRTRDTDEAGTDLVPLVRLAKWKVAGIMPHVDGSITALILPALCGTTGSGPNAWICSCLNSANSLEQVRMMERPWK